MNPLNPESDFVYVDRIRLHDLDWNRMGQVLILLTGGGEVTCPNH